MIYLIGSLKNPRIPEIGKELRARLGIEIFDSWYAPGPDADDFLRDYERGKGSTYRAAMLGHAAQHIFHFDLEHIDRSDIGVLVMPCGKSGHLELGYMVGQGKRCFILFDQEPERFDVMHNFAFLTGGDIVFSVDELVQKINENY